MISIRLGRKKYKGVYSWSDMTLERFHALASIPMPENYRQYLIADGSFSVDDMNTYIEAVEKITENQVTEEFPKYYRMVCYTLTNIPMDVELPAELVDDLYKLYFRPFVCTLVYNTPVISFMGQIRQYMPEKVKSFRIGIKRYYLPETVTIMGQDIPLKKETILTFTDASEYFRDMRLTADDIKRLALFMAIYCRRKGEQYNEETALERQAVMMRVPMSTVWAVFFCTARRLPSSRLCSRLFSDLPKNLREIVSEVQTYRNTAAGA